MQYSNTFFRQAVFGILNLYLFWYLLIIIQMTINFKLLWNFRWFPGLFNS